MINGFTAEEMVEAVSTFMKESDVIPVRLDFNDPVVQQASDETLVELRAWRDVLSKDEYVLFLFAKALQTLAFNAHELRDLGYDVATIMQAITSFSLLPQIIMENINEELSVSDLAELGIVDPEEVA